MAKKSNKTEHVLKLITKNDEAAQDDDFYSIDQEIAENGTSAVRNTVQVRSEEIEVSLKPSVEKELKYEAKLRIEIDPEIELKSKAPGEQIKPMGIEKEPPASAILQADEPPTVKAFREQVNVGSAVLEQNENLVNIAEVLAREKIALVMGRMKVCTCRTCVNDVLALALNSLPTKYVTTDAGKQYFQLDIYKKRYETDILAALTKACVRVKASPRH
ncbi:MAG TPA: late competence development ComFB family protein [Anaerovoracaceae bacterium]|nr:late competence development ComFB family protein [Anaerovoracaceae bacterium]